MAAASPAFAATDRGPCSTFQPQQWRNSKCKVCFHDKNAHNESGETVVAWKGSRSSINPSGESDKETVNSTGERLPTADNPNKIMGYDDNQRQTTDSKDFYESYYPEDDEHGKIGISSSSCTPTSANNTTARSKSVIHRSPKVAKSSRKDAVKLAAYEWSSNSSVASMDTFTSDDAANLTEGSMSDDEDEELKVDSSKSIVAQWSCEEDKNHANIDQNLDKIFDLQREIEDLKDSNRILRLSKDRETQCLEKEIGNLRLEVANLAARENLTVLKNRLELEGKCLRIEDLENETKHFRSEIERLTHLSGNPEDEKLAISRELDRKVKRIASLEEENKTLEDSLRLAEDLQNNDRELLSVLRNQVETLESDHKKSFEKNKVLEEKLKHVTETQLELEHEREKSSQMTRRVESMNEKLKHRERHIGDLEDDNVKLQQMKNELESRLMKECNAHQRQDANISDLKLTIDQSNSEVDRLSQENKRLKDARRSTSSSLVLQSYMVELEDRLDQAEIRNKHLEEIKDAAVKETKAVLRRLQDAERSCNELRKELKDRELTLAELEQLDKENEKQLTMLRKRLQKAEKQKKKAVHEILEMDNKIMILKEKYEETACRYEDAERDIRMLRLKLQSTEAKIAVMQNNKFYLESRLETNTSKDLNCNTTLCKTDVKDEHNHNEDRVESALGFSVNSRLLSEELASIDGIQSADYDVMQTKAILEENLSQLHEQDCALNANAGQLYTMSSMISNLEQQLETTRHMLSSKSSENVELRDAVAQLQADGKKIEQEKASLMKKVEEMVKDNELWKRSVKSLKQSIYELERLSNEATHDEGDEFHNDNVAPVVEALVREVEEKDQRIRELERLISTKENIITDLADQIQSLGPEACELSSNQRQSNFDACNLEGVSPDSNSHQHRMTLAKSDRTSYSSASTDFDEQRQTETMEDEVFEERAIIPNVNDEQLTCHVQATPVGLVESLDQEIVNATHDMNSINEGDDLPKFNVPQFVQGQKICINVPLPLGGDGMEGEADSMANCLPNMRFECDMDEDNVVSNVTVRSLNCPIRVNQRPDNVVHVTILNDGTMEHNDEVCRE